MAANVHRTGDVNLDRSLAALKREVSSVNRTATNGLTSLSGTVAALHDAADFGSFAHGGTAGAGETWHLAACGSNGGAAMGTTLLVANTLVAFPFVAPRRGGTVDRLSYEQTSVPGSAFRARLGIYSNDVDESVLYPGTLLVDGGELTPNPAAVKTATVSEALRPGALYWFVMVHNGAGVGNTLNGIRSLPSAACAPGFLGVGPSMGAVALRTCISVAFTYAALPASFPTGGAYGTDTPIALAARFA